MRLVLYFKENSTGQGKDGVHKNLSHVIVWASQAAFTKP
jgi:hypothetical protein